MRLSKDDERRTCTGKDGFASIKEWAEKDNPPDDYWSAKISLRNNVHGESFVKVLNAVGRSILHEGDTIVKDKNGNLWRLEDFE